MHWFGKILLCVLVVANLAQAEGVQFQDAAGDSRVQGVPVPGLDLLSGTVEVRGLDLIVSIVTDGGQQGQNLATATAAGAWEYWVEATYRGTTFHFVIDANFGSIPDPESPGQSVDTTLSGLYRLNEEGSFTKLHTGNGTVVWSTNTWSAGFPLAKMEAADGFVPGPGEPINLIQAVSYFDEGPGSPHDFSRGGGFLPIDRPLAGGGDTASFAAGAFLSVQGAVSSNLTLATPSPVRHSNGEATTYHWPISITNARTTKVAVAIQVDAPKELEVRAADEVELAPGESKVIDIFATAPFFHQHGGQRVVNVTATTSMDKTTIPLTISYLPVPQPAGHHPTLYLHQDNPGGGDTGFSWLDTLDEPERAHDSQMRLQPTICYVDAADGQNTIGFFMPLDPALLIGVDADLNKTAKLTARIDVQVPLQGGFIAAELVTYNPLEGEPALRVSDWTTRIPVSQSQSGGLDIEADLAIPPELDYMHPRDGRNLAFAMAICSDLVGESSPPVEQLVATMNHGAYIVMPLDEFHDAIPISIANGPSLRVSDGQERAPPGSKVQWMIGVEGPGDHYNVAAFGVAKDQTTLSAERIKPGESFQVALEIPQDARPGDTFEIVVSATDGADSLKTAATRLAVTVDAEAPAQDIPMSKVERGIPGVGLVAIALALAAVGLQRAMGREGSGPSPPPR